MSKWAWDLFHESETCWDAVLFREVGREESHWNLSISMRALLIAPSLDFSPHNICFWGRWWASIPLRVNPATGFLPQVTVSYAFGCNILRAHENTSQIVINLQCAFTQHFAPSSAKRAETGTFMANFSRAGPTCLRFQSSSPLCLTVLSCSTKECELLKRASGWPPQGPWRYLLGSPGDDTDTFHDGSWERLGS